jgi:cold shock CspA family protein/ribosome-associated translation inhibitor RaiA
MEIHWVHANELDSEDRRRAEDRIGSLAEGHSDLIDVRFVAKTTGHHQHGGAEVRITCQARGKEIVAARTRPDVSLALHDALDAFEGEIRRMRDIRQDRRVHQSAPPPELGIIDRVLVEEGYGFILTDSGDQVYFHRNAVHGGLDFGQLEEGQRVGLDFEPGDKGLQAITVVPAPLDAPSA